MKPLRAQTGFVVPTVIFALAILGVVAVAALSLSGDEQRSARAFRESGLALYSAEAGLRKALGSWDTAGVRTLTPGDSLVVGSGWTALPNHASYRVVIYKADSGQLQQFVVIAQGRRPSQVGGQATVTALVTGVPVFKWGIFTQNGITISGGGITDGYNSGNGPYDPTAIDSSGSLATNGNITLSGGGTAVKGDAAAAGTNSGGTVTGSRSNGVTAFPTLPTLACPAGGYTPAGNVPISSGITYNAATGVLTVSGGKNLTLTPPPSQYYFSSLTLSGGSTLTINSAGQHVDIYIENKLDLSGGGIINTAATQTALGIWACGTPASPQGWTLSGGSGAYFSVYAPNHDITVSGSGDLYGAIVGRSLNSSGGSKVHYDEALTQLPSKNLVTVSGSWAEVSAF